MNDSNIMSDAAKDNERWLAIVGRDAKDDGKFWYGVVTTGVYCKPSCASRRAKRANVRFFESQAAAVKAGFRPCKRCKPQLVAVTPSLAIMLDLCRYIEKNPQAAHSLASLAARANLSQFQVHRLFKSFLRLTPKEYIEQVRVDGFKRQLRSSVSVTAAIYDAGFESSSAVYGRLDAQLGMTPQRYRKGGEGVDISFVFGHTPLGRMLIGATDRGICYLQFGDSDRELLEQLAAEYPQATIVPSESEASEELAAWIEALNRHLDGKQSKAKLPLDVSGTAFQKRVWDFLQTIPYGEVLSYTEVAKAIDAPKAVRAVASACARNHVGILIPCHRIIRGNGALGGYRWGLARKRTLLDMERRHRVKQGSTDR